MLHIDAAIVLVPLMDELSHTCREFKISWEAEMLNHQVRNGMSRTG